MIKLSRGDGAPDQKGVGRSSLKIKQLNKRTKPDDRNTLSDENRDSAD